MNLPNLTQIITKAIRNFQNNQNKIDERLNHSICQLGFQFSMRFSDSANGIEWLVINILTGLNNLKLISSIQTGVIYIMMKTY